MQRRTTKSHLRNHAAAAFLFMPLAATLAASVCAAPSTVSLQVTGHANNASGATLVEGRTAPGAFVDVKVSAGVNQQVSTQRVRADANGNFSFSFTPQLPQPGARYEVNIAATHGDVRAESTPVLFQR